jgi:hypothetical protein
MLIKTIWDKLFMRYLPPFYCPRCRSWHWAYEKHGHLMTTGIVVTLCERCHDEVFHPYGRSR